MEPSAAKLETGVTTTKTTITVALRSIRGTFIDHSQTNSSYKNKKMNNNKHNNNSNEKTTRLGS